LSPTKSAKLLGEELLQSFLSAVFTSVLRMIRLLLKLMQRVVMCVFQVWAQMRVTIEYEGNALDVFVVLLGLNPILPKKCGLLGQHAEVRFLQSLCLGQLHQAVPSGRGP
jgi:hypothetical protein